MGGDIQLYPSDSDISSEQQSSEGSEKGGGRGATDSSYCSSYSPQPLPTPQYRVEQYSTLQSHHQYVTVQPCCAGYMSSLSSLPPPPATMLFPNNYTGETASLLSNVHGTLGRETPL